MISSLADNPSRREASSCQLGGPPITTAFQPIVDFELGEIESYEALVRGVKGEPPSAIFAGVSGEDLYQLDDRCRRVAVGWAAELGLTARLNLNCSPVAIAKYPGLFFDLFDEAERLGLNRRQLVLEITERETINDNQRFAKTIDRFRREGVTIAVDDFGAGFSGLALLATMQPDILKLDMKLLRGIGSHGPRQAIVRATMSVCFDLGIDVLAEGVETMDELEWCRDEGIELFQGYLLGRPALESLPDVDLGSLE